MRCELVLSVLWLSACFAKPDLSPALKDATPVDGEPPCSSFGAWSTPEVLPGVSVPMSDDSMAALSPDGSLLVFVSTRAGSPDLFVVPFDATSATVPQAIVTLNTGGAESHPAWSADGTKLYFSSSSGMLVSDVDLQVDPPVFASARSADELAALPRLTAPRFTADGRELFFVQDDDANAELAIHRSRQIAPGPWQSATVVTELRQMNATSLDLTISGDGRTLYFATNHFTGVFELHEATRVNLDAATMFGAITLVDLGRMRYPAISADGTLLVFSRYVSLDGDLFFSRRACSTN